MMTIEERRRAMLRFLKQKLAEDEKEIERKAAIAMFEELFAITDSWYEMAFQMKRMADAQEETLKMHKKIMAVPLHKGGEA